MILNFNTFKKLNKTGNELDTIREKNFDFFEKKGFPSKKDESWKYTDFKNIFDNAFNKVGILGKKCSKLYFSFNGLEKLYDNALLTSACAIHTGCTIRINDFIKFINFGPLQTVNQ